MNLLEILPEAQVLLDLKATSKRAAFQALSSVVAGQAGIEANQVLDLLLEREKLGTTGIGEGVAIPHAKIKDLPSLFGFFIRTTSAIDFDALDGKPVDLVFVLLAPEEASAEHLKALAKIARVFRDQGRQDALRKAATAAEIRTLFADEPATHAA